MIALTLESSAATHVPPTVPIRSTFCDSLGNLHFSLELPCPCCGRMQQQQFRPRARPCPECVPADQSPQTSSGSDVGPNTLAGRTPKLWPTHSKKRRERYQCGLQPTREPTRPVPRGKGGDPLTNPPVLPPPSLERPMESSLQVRDRVFQVPSSGTLPTESHEGRDRVFQAPPPQGDTSDSSPTSQHPPTLAIECAPPSYSSLEGHPPTIALETVPDADFPDYTNVMFLEPAQQWVVAMRPTPEQQTRAEVARSGSEWGRR